MSRIDCLILESLKTEALLLTEISNKIATINVKKQPTRIAIHARVRKLNEEGLIVCGWQEGQKIYKITTKGHATIK